MTSQPIPPPTDPSFEKTCEEVGREASLRYRWLLFANQFTFLFSILWIYINKNQSLTYLTYVGFFISILSIILAVIVRNNYEKSKLAELEKSNQGFTRYYTGWLKNRSFPTLRKTIIYLFIVSMVIILLMLILLIIPKYMIPNL